MSTTSTRLQDSSSHVQVSFWDRFKMRTKHPQTCQFTVKICLLKLLGHAFGHVMHIKIKYKTTHFRWAGRWWRSGGVDSWWQTSKIKDERKDKMEQGSAIDENEVQIGIDGTPWPYSSSESSASSRWALSSLLQIDLPTIQFSILSYCVILSYLGSIQCLALYWGS